MKRIVIDCSGIDSLEKFWEVYLQAAKPESAALFGRNLDAFWDALAGGPGWLGECELNFINTESVKKLRSGKFYEALQEIARESELVRVSVE